VFFGAKNAVTGTVFKPGRMSTIHTGSLTHEIRSYGGIEALIAFIANRFEENEVGGNWINRDVVAPENKDEEVLLWLNSGDGGDDYQRTFDHITDPAARRAELSEHLQSLSTYARFLRFAQDFRHEEGYQMGYAIEERDGKMYARLRMADACEFMAKKDYTDNWESENHETFCFWSFSDWKLALESAGYTVAPESKTYKNRWIEKNRWDGKVALYRENAGALEQMENPVTTMVMVAERQE